LTQLNYVNGISSIPLPSRIVLKTDLAISDAAAATVASGREDIVRIMNGDDPRLLLIVGPCSIHDPKAALEYARRLKALRDRHAKELCIIMRVYFEKPRTNIGWKGLIYDPDLNASDRIDEGLRMGREILLKINELGLPCASEFLEPVIPQYIADLVTWAAIGARTTESQTHREMTSGLSMPVGFKNRTDGNLEVAINAMLSAKHPHTFVGVNQEGITSLFRTKGNPWTHLVLRGGSDRPNYDEVSIAQSCEAIEAAKLPLRILVDCSHANSGKKPERQPMVMRSIVNQRSLGSAAVFGTMIESNLVGGQQEIDSLENLVYGQSITDSCLSWEDTEAMIEETATQLAAFNA
jgi:3-deoxy-7-phosphoheptulonate synthase